VTGKVIRLKILLIAYEFPPSASPQSLRWAYLVRELVGAGHHVHVLAPAVQGQTSDLLELVSGAVIHRVFPGPFAAIASFCSRILTRGASTASRKDEGMSPARKVAVSPRLNWKGKLAHTLKTVVGFFMFPDIRAEWNPWARRRLGKLLSLLSPDVVISSHEPASAVEIGRVAHAQGYPWVVDLGDPLLSPYTPRRWRRHAFRLERRVMNEANGVLVTSERTRDLLVKRQASGRAPCHVITQGFDDTVPDQRCVFSGAVFEPKRLELLYTGRLYAFRRIDLLLEALRGEMDARLTVVTHGAPAALLEAAARFPECIRVLGPLPHRSVLMLQRQCDILVNIANDDPVQVPGKFYEYLGANKPIIHVKGAATDAIASIFEASGHEDFIVSSVESLSKLLKELSGRKRSGLPFRPFSLSLDTEEYTWRMLAQRVVAVCQEAVLCDS
jgi:glycosyltransferase involved in cell wall biosynthesis